MCYTWFAMHDAWLCICDRWLCNVYILRYGLLCACVVIFWVCVLFCMCLCGKDRIIYCVVFWWQFDILFVLLYKFNFFVISACMFAFFYCICFWSSWTEFIFLIVCIVTYMNLKFEIFVFIFVLYCLFCFLWIFYCFFIVFFLVCLIE